MSYQSPTQQLKDAKNVMAVCGVCCTAVCVETWGMRREDLSLTTTTQASYAMLKAWLRPKVQQAVSNTEARRTKRKSGAVHNALCSTR